MGRTIALVGGGTMGPIVPLLALQRKLAERHPKDGFVWIGTPGGPEKEVVKSLGIPFIALPVAKLPRYISWRWLTWPWDLHKANREAQKIIEQYRPDAVISAGGFTQVPVIRAASKRSIPCLIHQLDFVPLLSNKLVAKYCRLVTTSFVYHHKKLTVPVFRYSMHKYPVEEVPIATPNRYVGRRPVEKDAAAAIFGLDATKPIVLFVGGGTGSRALNTAVENNLEKWLAKTQVIQVTGKGRGLGAQERPGYAKREFLDEQGMFNAYIAADVVVSRAGMGAITDLATLIKAGILVPINHSPQEQNARRLPIPSIIEVPETPQLFAELYRKVSFLLKHPEERQRMGYELHRFMRTDDGTEWANLVERYLPEEDE